MEWPKSISIYHKLLEPFFSPSNGFGLKILILAEKLQRPSVKIEEKLVFYDYAKAETASLPEFMVKGFEKRFEEQNELKTRNEARIRDLWCRVEALEKATLKIVDAKEDKGKEDKGQLPWWLFKK